MKPTKTAKNGKKSSGKKAAAGRKGKKTSPANAAGTSRTKEEKVRKKNTASAALAVKDESSTKDRVSARKKSAGTGTAGVKSGAVAKKTPSGKSVSPKKAARKKVGDEKTPKAGPAVRTTKKSTKSVSALPGSRKKGASAGEQLPAEHRILGAGQVRSRAPVKKSSGRILPKPSRGRSSRGKSQSGESPETKVPVAVRKVLPPQLPEEYGENEFFLIPVEPRVVYACWEIGKDSVPKEEGRLEVRFFDAVQARDGRADDRSFLDISVSDRIGDAFFNIAAQGREIIAEIGYLGADGYFVPVLRSRRVLIPSSFEHDETGMAVESPEEGGYGSRPPDK